MQSQRRPELDGTLKTNEFGAGVIMVGAILVFLGVCALVAIYMRVVHSFLQASERDEAEDTPPVQESTRQGTVVRQIAQTRREQWAH